MRHGVKKLKISQGRDANRALLRKLVQSFLMYGKVETTVPRAKYLKSMVDTLTHKSQRAEESDKNVLFKHLEKKTLVKYMISTVAGSFEKKTGGFVKMVRTGRRQGDNADMARLSWISAVELPTTKTVSAKKAAKSTTKKVVADKKATSAGKAAPAKEVAADKKVEETK